MTNNMGITEVINWLEPVRKEGSDKVFTMYLNTDRSDPNGNGDEWKIHLKNGLRNFEKYLQEDENKEEYNKFKKVKKKVMDYIKQEEASFLRGIVLFASTDDEIWFAKKVQMRVDSEFYWQDKPEIDQLFALKKTYPKLGVILVQQNQIKVIKSESNRVLDTVYYELDLETEDWREKQGPRAVAAVGNRGPNVMRDDFNSRFNANVQRWYKKIAAKLDKLAKDSEWEELYIVGDPDNASDLSKQMSKEADRIVKKNMLDHEESKVLDEVRAQ